MKKDIKGYESLYAISDEGLLWSYPKSQGWGNHGGKWLIPNRLPNGYLYYSLCKDGERKNLLAHRLVAEAFIGNPLNKNYVNHKNGIKDDNRIHNLEWVTPSENTIHAIENGLQNSVGENNPNSKLTQNDVDNIRRLGAENFIEIAKKFGITRTQVSNIIYRKVWRPVISIIIPSFNQSQYLVEAIESALEQTRSCEIIVIDDGNTDNSRELAESYQRRGVRVVSQVNKGLASARNTGIMWATGKYILPLDSDDILLPNCAEKILQEIEKNPSADVIAPSFKTFGKYNETVILMENPTLQDFKMGNRIGYFSAIKKETLLEVGGYSAKMLFGYEDFHLWIDLLSRGKRIATMKDVLVLYRTKEKSMITSAQEHHTELMNQIYKDFPSFAQ